MRTVDGPRGVNSCDRSLRISGESRCGIRRSRASIRMAAAACSAASPTKTAAATALTATIREKDGTVSSAPRGSWPTSLLGSASSATHPATSKKTTVSPNSATVSRLNRATLTRSGRILLAHGESRAAARIGSGTTCQAISAGARESNYRLRALWQDGRVSSPPTITPVLVAELLVEGERWPVYVHVIDHPDARVLVDTGMTELHPAVADMDPRLIPLSEQDFDLAGIDIVVNTHLHFDHCGGNHLFAGRPIYVQRRELDDARSEDDYTIREWVEAPGVQYVPVDGELELLPGLRLVPAPGHYARHAGGRRRDGRASGRRRRRRGGSSSASSTSRAAKASCGCERSTPSWSGSRTSTSRGGLEQPKPKQGFEPWTPCLQGALVQRRS